MSAPPWRPPPAPTGAARGQREGRQPEIAKTKIKLDRQIVAIAKVEGATAVDSDDRNVVAYAREAGLEGYRRRTCRPPEDPQHAPAAGVDGRALTAAAPAAA